MANRRMFSMDVVDTDKFLDMPTSTQALYFQLGMRADDDGFVASPKRIITIVGASPDDLHLLVAKGFVILFEDGIIVITHWKRNNYIQKDRYKASIYKDKATLLTVKNETYELDSTLCIQDVSNMDTQYSKGKYSIVKDSINTICSEPKESAPTQSGILLPLNDKSFYDVPLDKIALWKDTYPAVDVVQELKKMVAWLDSNPIKRKTRRGIDRFINNWLSREQDKGGKYQNATQQKFCKPQNSFNQFSQNNYDYEQLEKELLSN